ncbi:MAG: hypothetical protein M1818_001547 [Claussenomyces sp. TS43310]|nr:MAG: hypothetical protein M1818_001547 [Claussenomyces sp. TS43310]
MRECLTALLATEEFERSQYPGSKEDVLYEPSYRHKHQDPKQCAVCSKCEGNRDEVCQHALGATCVELKCDDSKRVPRRSQGKLMSASSATLTNQSEPRQPLVHFGKIASGDTVMKSGEERDRLAAREGIIALEMERAGIWDNFSCIVIKGVCDYADGHKNKKWQSYAALTAAACMKAFLKEWPSIVKASTGTKITEQHDSSISSASAHGIHGITQAGSTFIGNNSGAKGMQIRNVGGNFTVN